MTRKFSVGPNASGDRLTRDGTLTGSPGFAPKPLVISRGEWLLSGGETWQTSDKANTPVMGPPAIAGLGRDALRSTQDPGEAPALSGAGGSCPQTPTGHLHPSQRSGQEAEEG